MNDKAPDRLFKKLTPANWLQHDGTADHIVRVDQDGGTSPVTDDDWAGLILEIELSPAVPEDVRDLFEVAQGVLCYGCFFYPLYTLGNEQVYRVLEAAVTHKCGALGLSRSADRFGDKIDRLFESGFLSPERHGQWHAVRRLRNASSHAGRQSLIDPTMAVRGLRTAAELIDDLFALRPSTGPDDGSPQG